MADTVRVPPHRAAPTAQEKDDLQLITGIGPAIEQRLNALGIYTYAQVAEMSAQEAQQVLELLPRVAANNLVEHDWIEQASKLAEAAAPGNPRPAALDRQHYELFTVELLVDPDGSVRRTHVVHAQEKEKQELSWAGWEAARLEQFIAHSTDIRLRQTESLPAGQPPGEPESGTAPYQTPAGIVLELPRLAVREVVILAQKQQIPLWNVVEKQPFRVRLELALESDQPSRAESAVCEASVYARRLGRKEAIPLGSAQQTLGMTPPFYLDVETDGLPAGDYRIEALVSLSLVDANSARRIIQRAMSEGQPFTVRREG